MRLTQPSLIPVLTLLAVGCRDDRTETGDETSGGPSTTLTTTTSDESSTSTSGSSSTTDATLNPDTSGTTTGGGNTCEFIQCGTECCDDDEECVLEACQPICDTQVRCGADLSVCCAAGDVCLQPECVTPGADCLDSYDCPDGEFCEPTLGKCLPNQDPVACEIVPTFTEVDLTLEWSWEADWSNTMPLVADIDGDMNTDVVVVARLPPSDGFEGQIVVLEGSNGTEKLRIEDNPAADSYAAYMRGTPALADVDGNGLPDIIYAGMPTNQQGVFNRSLIHAIDGVGQHLWSTHNSDGTDHWIYTRNGGVLATNLDDDPESEIVHGIAVTDNDGLVVSDAFNNEFNAGSGVYGSPPGYLGGIATAVDIDGDSYPEIVSGREGFSITWDDPGIGSPNVTVNQLWTAGGDDGFPAIGDLDQNGTPEVIIVTNGVLRVLESDTGMLWCGRDSTGAACAGNDAARTQPIVLADDGMGGEIGRGGPATVADFDGDGRPEVGVAGASAYAVYDFNREGEEVVQPGGFLPPGPGDIYVRWFAATRDASSNVTGSSVFDFQGDGAAEVMYQDECYAWVFDGATGSVLVQLENSSPTIHEYPVVADVDGDGNTEFMVVAANSNPELCMDLPGYQGRQGVFVYGDANDRWVRTRSVWTQHTYHVTNATSSGLTPMTEEANWLQPGLNNFRQNSQGEGIFNAPDLSVEIAVGLSTCLDEVFEIYVTVRNEGSIGVAAGVPVSLYEGTDASGMLVGTQMTMQPLLPGAFTQFVWNVPAPAEEPKNYYAAVDGADTDTSQVLECNEDNNEGATETVACPIPG
ncbi:MAG: hypothetical protein K1X88_35005 [Nannocystaceae bacterium]|nr:hypothetical protein [Nannocystaceae bacterium]